MVVASVDERSCPRCQGTTVVEKTVERTLVTLAHGSVRVHEVVRVCRGRCRHGDGTLVRRGKESLAQHVAPGGVFGYDVLVYVGLERFLHHRQREEIREDLRTRHGIAVSAGEVSVLARDFLDHLEALHHARAPALAQALREDGGWPLHVDATGEDGRGTLLVLFAGWRRWVLGSSKIPTERAEAILPALRDVAVRFGDPCAVMRDLGKAVSLAVQSLLEERAITIPVLSCHFHFVQDVGKDLLSAGYAALREGLREAKVTAQVRTLARDLGREIGTRIAAAREVLETWKKNPDPDPRLPTDPVDALAVVRGLAQWVLDFPSESTYRRFPFDRPLVDLYHRMADASRATAHFLRTAHEDARVRSALRRMERALDAVVCDEDLSDIVLSLMHRGALLDALRDTLRLRPASSDAESLPSARRAPAESPTELRDVETELDEWTQALRAKRPSRGPACDRRKAVDLVLDHIDRHRESLFGHVIALPGGGLRAVERTNNIEEGFFRRLKQAERRRSGRKSLAQDFERLPPAAALVPNLERPDYVAILCGSLEALPAAFADLDVKLRDTKRSGRVARQAPTPHPAVESASLPAADRRIVRSEAMTRRIQAAANSRAPRANRVG